MVVTQWPDDDLDSAAGSGIRGRAQNWRRQFLGFKTAGGFKTASPDFRRAFGRETKTDFQVDGLILKPRANFQNSPELEAVRSEQK